MSIYDKSSLVLIPSGTKTGKVYSQKPVSGDGDFTFTRSSAATRVNAAGNIEKETQNLFRYSEEFNQGSAWSKQGGAQISPNASTAPDGTNTADLLYPAITGVVKAAIQSFTSGNGTPYAQSIYVKASGKNFAALYALNGNAGPAMWVNLTTGEITNGSIPNAFGQFATSVGNGWWRIGFTDIGNGGISYMHIYPTDVAGSQNVTANGTDGILIWGAQLEYGLVARDYIETTTTAVEGGITDNVPRLDYTDSSCPALLLEPQRTNVLQNSEYFSGSDWINNGVTITNNAVISPEGKTNAALLTGVSGGFGIVKFSTWTATNKVASCFAKAGSGNIFKIANVSAANRYVLFDLSDGTISEESASWTGSIEDFGNGWYRCTAISNNETGTFSLGTTAASDSVYIYGAQLEAASYATSYIPTYGSSVTRVAEAALKTGVADLINDGDGTLYMEVTPTNFEGDQRFGISDNIGSNRIVLRLYNPSNLQFSCVINSSVEVSIANSGYSAGNTYKIAGAWKNNDAVIYVNGVQVATDTDCNITPSNPLTRISFDNGVGTAKWENPVSQTLYFPTRLSNEELAALTTI